MEKNMKNNLFGILILLVISTLFFYSCDLSKSNHDNEEEYFPVFKVEASSYYDLGFEIGHRFAEQTIGRN